MLPFVEIEIGDPNEDEFYYLFQLYCESFGIEYRKDVVHYLIDKYYRPVNRAMRGHVMSELT